LATPPCSVLAIAACARSHSHSAPPPCCQRTRRKGGSRAVNCPDPPPHPGVVRERARLNCCEAGEGGCVCVCCCAAQAQCGRWGDRRAATRRGSRRARGRRRRTRSCSPTLSSTATAAGARCPPKPVSSLLLASVVSNRSDSSISATLFGLRWLLLDMHADMAVWQGCSGAARAAASGGRTTSGRTSSGASSACRRSRPSSSSTLCSATGERSNRSFLDG
jgi:hypothetical protein